MFAPVAKARTSRAPTTSAPWPRAVADAATAPTRPVYLEVPTDLLRRRRAARHGADWPARRPAAPTGDRGRARCSTRPSGR